MHNCHSKKNSKLNSTPVCLYFESRLIINKVEKKVVVFFCLIYPTAEIWSELLHRKTKAETV